MRTAPAPPSPFPSAASSIQVIACRPARVAELVRIELFQRPRRQCRVGLFGRQYGIARDVGVAFRSHVRLRAKRESSATAGTRWEEEGGQAHNGIGEGSKFNGRR